MGPLRAPVKDEQPNVTVETGVRRSAHRAGFDKIDIEEESTQPPSKAPRGSKNARSRGGVKPEVNAEVQVKPEVIPGVKPEVKPETPPARVHSPTEQIDLTADEVPAEVLPTNLFAYDDISPIDNDVGELLTAQQLAIVNASRAPNAIPVNGEILRVTAAAGTGKTTTLVEVGKCLRVRGHHRVSYVTFNKAAAADAATRLGPGVECRTIHSLAFHLLGVGTLESGGGLLDDHALQKFVMKTFELDIERTFKRGAPTFTQKRTRAFWIVKTLVNNFLQSDLSEKQAFDIRHQAIDMVGPSGPFKSALIYYPALKHYKELAADPQKKGSEITEWEAKEFYRDCVERLWKILKVGPGNSGSGKYTYDSVMKQAQLSKVQATTRAILVDESQDLTACQVDWMKGQTGKGARAKQVFFVGDAAQTVYGFRGAKSEHLMSLQNTRDFDLTQSFRFDGNIAKVANAILFAKANSPQRGSFRPYKVFGAGGDASNPSKIFCHDDPPFNAAASICRFMDTCAGLANATGDNSNDTKSVTILAFTNVALVNAALQLLAARPGIRIAVNGGASGDSSGMGKYRKLVDEIEHVYKLFTGEATTLPASFYEFVDDNNAPIPFTAGDSPFDALRREVQAREINKYDLHVNLITLYAEHTLAQLDMFKLNVINAKVKPGNCDVLISTIHNAKGAEWRNVFVMNDLAQMAAFSVDEKSVVKDERDEHGGFRNASIGGSKIKEYEKAQFAWSDKGNEFNLWYVAVTRAKQNVCVPRKFVDVPDAFACCLELVQKPRVVSTNGRSDLLLPYGDETENEDAFKSVPRVSYLTRLDAKKYKANAYAKPAPQLFDPAQLMKIMDLGNAMTYFMGGAMVISPV
jgi:superfamily I DNA/RNA helicase